MITRTKLSPGRWDNALPDLSTAQTKPFLLHFLNSVYFTPRREFIQGTCCFIRKALCLSFFTVPIAYCSIQSSNVLCLQRALTMLYNYYYLEMFSLRMFCILSLIYFCLLPVISLCGLSAKTILTSPLTSRLVSSLDLCRSPLSRKMLFVLTASLHTDCPLRPLLIHKQMTHSQRQEMDWTLNSPSWRMLPVTQMLSCLPLTCFECVIISAFQSPSLKLCLIQVC